MSERSVLLLLQDIEIAISKILRYTEGFTFPQYERDDKTREAVERNFEIIGEASSRIPQSLKDSTTEVEWRILKDFRNFIIHDYFGINHQIVWNTIELRLPELLSKIKMIIKSLPDNYK
jgi:uncharacterized protein with HEPN domain